MKKKNRLMIIAALALLLPVCMMIMAMSWSGDRASGEKAPPPRPEGPCDIYAAGGSPCVAAHSSTRALYASYNGPLYQVMRQADDKTLDIGVVQSRDSDPGGYADAAAQDSFCANSVCWVTVLYDQSGKGNNLVQAPHGGFNGPAMGGFNNVPVADMAPVTIMGHKVYGIFIEPGMGLRLNDAKGTAVDDQAEGQYWVINGHHYNNGCCYDYGNAETDSRDDGDGTMETAYYGNANYWYHGSDAGPWVMTDQENNLVGCVNQSPKDKSCPLPSIKWRFVTAMADGEPHHWRSMGGDAQHGDLEVMFDGTRITNDRSSYDPMRKQGAILLGNGGDNSNGSQGTFYEGAMTAAGTFPTKETNQKIQANVVAAAYNAARVKITPAAAIDFPPGLQTFSPGSSQNTTVIFTNTDKVPVKNVSLRIVAPKGWQSAGLSERNDSKEFTDPIMPGASVSATFKITSGVSGFNGDLVGKASWTDPTTGKLQSDIASEKVRNVSPVRINEFRVSDGSAKNSTNSFIELYNAGNTPVDISNWSLTQHSAQLPIFSSVNIPAATKLPVHGFYLLGLSASGLAVAAKKDESTIYVRSITGMSAGDEITIDNGTAREIRKVTRIGTAAGLGEPKTPSPFFGRADPGSPTTIWQPLPEGPVITIPAGSTNVPVASVDGFEVGQKIAIGYGAIYPAVANAKERYEWVTVTRVGRPGTQAYLSADVKAGESNIKVSSVANISVGDKIRLDIDSKGHGIETVTVKRVGTQSVRNTLNGPLKNTEDAGTGLELEEPLRFNHAGNIPFSVKGTGISFEPATAFAHSSNEPVLPLGTGVTLDQPLSADYEINTAILDKKAATAGYQGSAVPNQWFGGPALSSSAGSILLRDGRGNVVDGLNYGGLVDPWIAEGDQGMSGTGQNGCSVPSPGPGRGFRTPNPGSQPNRSAGRYPDGSDNDNNCHDFLLQTSAALALPSKAGSTNVKVASITGFYAGQKVFIGSGEELETTSIRTVGTAGGSDITAAADAGNATIHVVSVTGFEAGQTVTVGGGVNSEKAVIASIAAVRRRFGMNANAPTDSITFTTPLKYAHPLNEQVAGSGITLANPLTRDHDNGSQVASDLPTPGKPNQYTMKP